MKHLIKFALFELSGVEIVGDGNFGPNYGHQSIPNTVDTDDTVVIYSEINNKLYTKDDYDNLYLDYLKSGGKDSKLSVFDKENLDKLLSTKSGL